jgi:peroxiredoxin
MKTFLTMLLTGITLSAQPSAAMPRVPRPAPPLNLLLPCKSKTTLLAFINTNCSHCKEFTKTVMEPIHESGSACVLAVAFDEDGDINQFAREQRIRFPLYKIERKQVRRFLGISGPDQALGTPQVVVIDKRGMIQAQSEAKGSPLLLQPEVIRAILRGLP